MKPLGGEDMGICAICGKIIYRWERACLNKDGEVIEGDEWLHSSIGMYNHEPVLLVGVFLPIDEEGISKGILK